MLSTSRGPSLDPPTSTTASQASGWSSPMSMEMPDPTLTPMKIAFSTPSQAMTPRTSSFRSPRVKGVKVLSEWP